MALSAPIGYIVPRA